MEAAVENQTSNPIPLNMNVISSVQTSHFPRVASLTGDETETEQTIEMKSEAEQGKEPYCTSVLPQNQ